MAVGFRKQCDRMDDSQLDSTRGATIDQLEEAAWVSGGDDVGPCRGDMIHLPFEQLARHFGLSEVIDASATATPSGFGQFDEAHARDLL